MGSKLNLSLPSINMIAKVAIAMVIVFFVVSMTPDTWGIKRFFTAS